MDWMELYKTNRDFKEYVDRVVQNKDVSLEEVLSYKQTQLVGQMYRENAEQALKNAR